MEKITSLLIFDIWGKMAHFRKYYTNSSSLSYSFPPPTTLLGTIAGILGYERDSYYQVFSMDQVKIAVKMNTKVRKTMQTVNHVRTKGFSEFNGSAGHTQIPLELLLPTNKRISYRIYLWHKDIKIVNELKKRIKEKRYIYPPYMGASEFIAYTEFVDFIEKNNIQVKKSDGYLDISTIVNMKHLEDRGLFFENPKGDTLKYNKEKMVREFDEYRKPKEIGLYISEENGNDIYTKLNDEYCQVKYTENINNENIDTFENITFL